MWISSLTGDASARIPAREKLRARALHVAGERIPRRSCSQLPAANHALGAMTPGAAPLPKKKSHVNRPFEFLMHLKVFFDGPVVVGDGSADLGR
jgi:hypothetical protein